MHTRIERGFTLIELMVVISIIGLLSAGILSSLSTASQRSRDANRIADIKQIQNALELYAADNGGRYPVVASSFVSQLNSALVPKYIPTLSEDPIPARARYRYWTTTATSYSILIDLESDNASGVAWCLIKLGTGYTAWDQYPACDL
ncbi:type II secretion system GspH family protein [Patescibacteria group bacterium]|nr:type II secretion system GspH family protein [Patescibacteria group bacterium]